MADIKYDIIKEIGVLSENAKGWRKELNLISWNGGAAKYDHHISRVNPNLIPNTITFRTS